MEFLIQKIKSFFSSHKDLIAVLGLIILSSSFFLKGFLENQLIWGFDTPKIIYPLISLLDESFKNFHLPLWTPDIYFGFPIGSEGQIGWFYILNIFHVFLPLNLTVLLLSLLHVSLAGIFTYIFGRLIGLNRFPSVFSSIVFMFNGFIIAHFQYFDFLYAYAYLPLVLILVELGIQKNKVIFFLFAGLVSGIQLVTGHPNIPVMTIIYAVLYCFFRIIQNKPAANKFFFLKSMAVMIGTAVIIALPYLLLTLSLVPLSIRGGGVDFADATNSSFSLFDLITFLFPNFFFDKINGSWIATNTWHFWSYWGQIETTGYVGIITLFFLPFGLLNKMHKKVLIFFALLLISLLLALGKNTPMYFLLIHVPIFNGLRAPGRFLYLVDFSLAILAGYGISFLFQTKNINKVKLNITVILTSCLIFVFVAVGLFFNKFHPDQVSNFIRQNYSQLGFVANLDNTVLLQKSVQVSFQEQTKLGLFLVVISLLIFLLIQNGYKNLFIKFLIILLIVVDLFGFASKVNIWKRFDDLTNTADPTINRLKDELTYDNGRVYTFNFWSGLMPDQLLPYHIPEANGFASLPMRRFESWQKIAEKDWQEGKEDLFRIGSIKYVYDENNLVSVNNPLPRAYTTSKWIIAKTEAEAFSLLSNGKTEINSVILEADKLENSNDSNNQVINPATISVYRSDYVKIYSDTTYDGVLVLTDTNYPGWKAYLNGKEVPIYQANYLFRGVKIPAGNNAIEFKYRPRYLYTSIMISIGFGLFILFILVRRLLKRLKCKN